MVADFFALFGLPRRYALERAELDRRYGALQRRLHPDNHATASAAERTAALRRSSQVNDAYRALCSPLERARHLLSCHGVASADQLAEGTVADSAFLMEQLAAREQIEALDERGDTAGLRRLARDQAAAFAALARDFDHAEAEGRAAAALELFQRMQFLDRLRTAAEECAAGATA